jgi:hypothetical protein
MEAFNIPPLTRRKRRISQVRSMTSRVRNSSIASLGFATLSRFLFQQAARTQGHSSHEDTLSSYHFPALQRGNHGPWQHIESGCETNPKWHPLKQSLGFGQESKVSQNSIDCLCAKQAHPVEFDLGLADSTRALNCLRFGIATGDLTRDRLDLRSESGTIQTVPQRVLRRTSPSHKGE